MVNDSFVGLVQSKARGRVGAGDISQSFKGSGCEPYCWLQLRNLGNLFNPLTTLLTPCYWYLYPGYTRLRMWRKCVTCRKLTNSTHRKLEIYTSVFAQLTPKHFNITTVILSQELFVSPPRTGSAVGVHGEWCSHAVDLLQSSQPDQWDPEERCGSRSQTPHSRPQSQPHTPPAQRHVHTTPHTAQLVSTAPLMGLSRFVRCHLYSPALQTTENLIIILKWWF